VQIGLDGGWRASDPSGDLVDREVLDVAVVAGERGGTSAFRHVSRHRT
jgi:hypothetical protein